MEFTVSPDDESVAYLKLLGHPTLEAGVVNRSIRLRDLIQDYQGADIILDFSEDSTLIGIEILV